MPAVVIAYLAGLLFGNQAWAAMGDQAPELMPQMLELYEKLRCGLIDRALLQRSEAFGVHHVRMTPVYLRHLQIPENAKDLPTILNAVHNAKTHVRLFVPHAARALESESLKWDVLWYLSNHGTTREAKSVAVMLLKDKITIDQVRLILECLSKIGGKDEFDVLRTFIVKSIGENPKLIWQQEVDACRKAIEARLEAEAKSLKAEPVR